MKKLLLLSSTKFLATYPVVFGKSLRDYKMLHIITASKGARNLDYLEWNRKFFGDLHCERLEYDLQGKTPTEVQEVIAKHDLVYVEGGNTYLLLKSIRESGFEQAIKNALLNGTVYMGASAGSYVACPTIETTTWKRNDTRETYGVTDMRAMRLVPFLLFVHYKPEYRDLVKEKIAEIKYDVKILTDDNAVEVTGDSFKLVGDEIIL